MNDDEEFEATVFLVSPFVPFPPARGIELRIFRLLKWLSSAGFKVILIVPADSIDLGALTELRKVTHAIHWTKPAFRTRLGMRLPYLRSVLWEPLKPIVEYLTKREKKSAVVGGDAKPDDGTPTRLETTTRLGDDRIKSWFASEKLVALVGECARKYEPHAVIVEYIFSTPVFAALPRSSIRIVDTIDVFSRKEDQVLAFGIADPLACSEEEERRQLLMADVIIAIQSREMTLLKDLVPEREVILAGMDLDVPDNPITNEVIRGCVTVVASDNPLNVHGLSEFLTKCWPMIKGNCPFATLHVVGRVGDLCKSDDPSIRYSGWVDDLDGIYREASVVINPTIAGTGLKIKSVQAMAHGKPLVAWTNGVEGLSYTGAAPYLECRSWEQFESAVVRLLTSDSERARLAARAVTYARHEFSAETVYASLAECLNTAKSEKSRSIRDKRLRSPRDERPRTSPAASDS